MQRNGQQRRSTLTLELFVGGYYSYSYSSASFSSHDHPDIWSSRNRHATYTVYIVTLRADRLKQITQRIRKIRASQNSEKEGFAWDVGYAKHKYLVAMHENAIAKPNIYIGAVYFCPG